ncbi:RHS repeat-associated core domain-containing protein, partial [Comamonadaceae bacterium OH2545_COT-014]
AFGAAGIIQSQSTIEMNLRFPGQYFDQETNSHYNFHRDYKPNLGRYLQSDPIGLNGGVNWFAYVTAKPTKLLDDFGLIEWKGDYHARSAFIGFGGGWVDFDLTSECVDGKKYKVRVVGRGLGAGIGIPGVAAAETYGKVVLNDRQIKPNPIYLNGSFLLHSFGYTIGKKTMGLSYVRVGWAVGETISSTGFDAGISGMSGRAKVTSAVEVDCGCES